MRYTEQEGYASGNEFERLAGSHCFALRCLALRWPVESPLHQRVMAYDGDK